VERGFASVTLGEDYLGIQPGERARVELNPPKPLARLARQLIINDDPRVPLAKPRFTLGYMFSLLRRQRTVAVATALRHLFVSAVKNSHLLAPLRRRERRDDAEILNLGHESLKRNRLTTVSAMGESNSQLTAPR